MFPTADNLRSTSSWPPHKYYSHLPVRMQRGSERWNNSQRASSKQATQPGWTPVQFGYQVSVFPALLVSERGRSVMKLIPNAHLTSGCIHRFEDFSSVSVGRYWTPVFNSAHCFPGGQKPNNAQRGADKMVRILESKKNEALLKEAERFHL